MNIDIDECINSTSTILEFLQKNCNVSDETTARNKIATIAAIIQKIVQSNAPRTVKQTILNISFRTYYNIAIKYNVKHQEFNDFLEQQMALLVDCKEQSYELLYALLLAENAQQFDVAVLATQCLKGLSQCQIRNESSVVTMLRTTNLVLKKCNSINEDTEMICLEQIYAYLQMNQCGMREEALILFNYYCKSTRIALPYFSFIVNFYPWTNRNKFYLLSCILNTHSLQMCLEHCTGQTRAQFFAGLRLSLSYKRLLPASQYLVKALSKQNSQDLLETIIDILLNGTVKEISNLNANWFARISQKEELFELLQQTPKVGNVFENFNVLKSSTEIYRFILILNMFSRYIFNASKPIFFKLSSELPTNCGKYELESQFLIYKFIVDNLNYFAFDGCLEFLANFIKSQKNIENTQLRNNIIGKMPTIINFISKDFRKSNKKNYAQSKKANSLFDSIKGFFGQLNTIIEADILSNIYQPKIFSLKLLEVLLTSLYQKNLVKNTKNCCLQENCELGKFLIAENVFNAERISTQLTKALNDPLGFDDALDLIVNLIKKIEIVKLTEIIETCKKLCESVNIDECILSTRYAAIALACINVENTAKPAELLFEYALKKLQSELETFQNDPLLTCKTSNHIFGFVNIINATLCSVTSGTYTYADVLSLLEQLLQILLELLNTSTNSTTVGAASFQDIDKSLELLVSTSSFHAENHEECRKFLLMSFWLTLKSCCDTATTLGCLLAPKNEPISDLESLKRCLCINVTVLTRCRHKGAIEAAGLSLGKLTKYVTTHCTEFTKINELFYGCLSLLFDAENLVSTTRRGAGFSIMFLHIIKNDQQPEKPILKHCMARIFKNLESNNSSYTLNISNCDRIEALTLHYLCVLVKDAELRDALLEYRNKIIFAAIAKIDDTEWTICNAALQLFGALVPKIVGQKQSTEFDEEPVWESTDITYHEIATNMPATFSHILNYCAEHSNESRCVRSIILFLGFLSKIEYLAEFDKAAIEEGKLLFQLRNLMWSLLNHSCEKVRKLAALCFIRAHEFRSELPTILLNISDIIFSVQDENFFQGLILVLQAGVIKIQNEGVHTLSAVLLNDFLQKLQINLVKNYKLRSNFKLYTQTKILEMMFSTGFDSQLEIIRNSVKSLSLENGSSIRIGYDAWCEKVSELF